MFDIYLRIEKKEQNVVVKFAPLISMRFVIQLENIKGI